MADNSPRSADAQGSDFAKQAELAKRGLLAEFFEYLRYNKKWWLTPIIIVLLLVGGLVLLGGTAAAPFIYTLFYVVQVAWFLARRLDPNRCVGNEIAL